MTHRSVFVGEARGQVGEGEEPQPLGEEVLAAPHVLDRHHPLAGQPHRCEHGGQDRLDSIPEKEPGDPGARGPQHEATRPVLLQIEDLSRQEDAGAERHGPGAVQRLRQHVGPLPEECRGGVERADHHEDQREAAGGRHLVPVGGDEQQNTGAQEQAAEDAGEDHGPPAPAATLAVVLERLDALRRAGVDEPRLDPAPKRSLPVLRHRRFQ